MAKHRTSNPTRSTRLQRHDRAVKAGKPCWDMECIKCQDPKTANPHGQMPWTPKAAKPRGPRKEKPLVVKPMEKPAVRLGLGEELLGDLLGELAEARTDTALNIVWAHRNSLLPLMCASDKERTQRVWELQYQILACSPRFRKPAPPPEPARQRRAPPPVVIERGGQPKGILQRIFGSKSSRVYATPASWGAHKLFTQIAQKVRTA